MSVNYNVRFAFKEKATDEKESWGETNVTADAPIKSANDYYQISAAIGRANNYESVRILFTIPPAENMEEIIQKANVEDTDSEVIEGEIVE